MAEPEIIPSFEELFTHQRFKAAEVLEFSVHNCVRFRLASPLPVFQMVEARLCKRDPDLYRGLAEARMEMENSHRGSTVREKVEAACLLNPRWISNRQIIYSTELEVWMDISYPNPLALELHHRILQKGKSFQIHPDPAYTDIFHELLMEKIGFQSFLPQEGKHPVLRVQISQQDPAAPDSLQIFPNTAPPPSTPFGEGASLSEQIVHGLLLKDFELGLAHSSQDRSLVLRGFAYGLVGPTLLLLIQELRNLSGPVEFSGIGSGFLTTLCQSIQWPWPWLPEISTSGSAQHQVSILSGKSSSLSLIPSKNGLSASVFHKDEFHPADLLLPPLHIFLRAAMKGPLASRIQADAMAFILDYARATRGLCLPLPKQPVLRAWHQKLLSPETDFLRVFSTRGSLPGWKRPRWIGGAAGELKRGPWPTGSYEAAGKLVRSWMRIWAWGRVRSIRAAGQQAKGRPEGD